MSGFAVVSDLSPWTLGRSSQLDLTETGADVIADVWKRVIFRNWLGSSETHIGRATLAEGEGREMVQDLSNRISKDLCCSSNVFISMYFSRDQSAGDGRDKLQIYFPRVPVRERMCLCLTFFSFRELNRGFPP